MKILVLNCGSSSLKYQLIDGDTEELLAKGLCERIGIDGALTHEPTGKDKVSFTDPLPDHKVAVSRVLEVLLDPEYGVIKSVDEIGACGHRIVQVENILQIPFSLQTKLRMQSINVQSLLPYITLQTLSVSTLVRKSCPTYLR